MKKFYLNRFIRKNIFSLSAYDGLREKYFDKNAQFQDANELPFGKYSKYPDSYHKDLIELLATVKNLKSKNIFLGNGSEELIDTIIRIFCKPKKDVIFLIHPTYCMYQYFAVLNDIKTVTLFLDENFNIDKEEFIHLNHQWNGKILFLCSPNNPTGNCLADLEYYIENFKGLVVIDEAYHRFSSQESCLSLMEKYPHLIIIRTLSKAFGMAGLRIGIGIASEELATLITNVRPPYTISTAAKEKAIEELSQFPVLEARVAQLLVERDFLKQNLSDCACIKKIFPTEANFFLVEFFDVVKVYNYLLEKNIVTSIKHAQIPNCIRINVGSRAENETLISLLKDIK